MVGVSAAEGADIVSKSRSPASAATRLSADDWVERGLALLMAEGLGAIKISRLCRELGVTKGSFYWHFADVDALMAAIAERWCTQTREELSRLQDVQGLPPLDRIRAMGLRLVDDASWHVERALREWSAHDPDVAEVLRETERFIFGVVQQALLELGYDAAAARLRAGLLVYAGIGFAYGQLALPKPTAEDINDLVGFIAGDVAR
jgi:AcrR family transcriptional regulator